MGAGLSRRVEPLAPQHDRSSFDSGVEALDRYFRIQAGQDARKHMAAPFVLLDEQDRVLGYYTLSATSIALVELPAAETRRLPRYPVLPATLLGRLAVDRRVQGHGHGLFLLADALHRALRSEIAAFAVVVDAKDTGAARFYQREGFMPLPERPLKLFLPMASLTKPFG